jgi:hypothetical protein
MAFSTSLLWQNDDRWASTTLGFGPQTIKDWGCLTTSLTMVVNGCGYNETPATVSKKMTAINAYFGAAINAYRIGDAYPGVALAELVDCENTAAPLDRVDAELEAGRPVLVRVDWNAAPGLQDHWVVIYDKDATDYIMFDPWKYSGDTPNKVLYLTQRYKFSGLTPAEAITSVIFFTISGAGGAPAPSPTPAPAPAPAPIPTPSPTKLPIPPDAVTVMPTTDAVAFRGAPSATGPLLRRFSLNVSLVSVESRAATLPKIGVDGKWLNVQAPEGDQGYVAAWYVRAVGVPAPTPTPAPSPAPAPGGNTVKVIQDQLAFRSQPILNDTTLISRFPLGTVLNVTDPDANKKIGVMNQWLKVKDASGREGYVAAWYVSR